MVEQDTSHQHSTVEPFFFTQRLLPFPKYENFKSRLWTVVSVCIATNDAVLIWPWSSRRYLNSVRSSFISAQTVLQERAPWHGPVACIPGQIHSSMVRPPSQAQNNLPVVAESLARKLERTTILRHGRQHEVLVE